MNFNATLIGQSITFLIFVWFCMKYVWPPLMAALELRKGKIADGLAAAERGQKDLKLAQGKVSENLKESKQQAQDIITLAQKRAHEIVDEAKEAAHEEAAQIKAAASSDIEQQINSAREHLRKEVSAIALVGVEQILKREVNAETHSNVLDDLMTQI